MVQNLVVQINIMLNRITTLERALASGGLKFSPVADPAPDGGGWGGWRAPWQGPWQGHFGGFGGGIPSPIDPSPLELGKLSRVQLESRLADISYTRVKLDALEGLLNEAIKQQG